MRRLTFGSLAIVSLIAVGIAAEEADPAAPAQPDRAALEKQFAETMSGATLVGSFTVTGQAEKAELKEERYTLGDVKKLDDDFWLFETRIQYGERDVKVPLQLEVKWAGDTPVIVLTDTPIPGLGTFTARVVVYRDHYCGYWDAGDHGGHLFGTIERAKEDAAAE